MTDSVDKPSIIVPSVIAPSIIAVVTQFPLDANTPQGGVEAVSINLVRSLAKYRDIEVHVVTLNEGIGSYQKMAWEGATIHRLPKPRGSEIVIAVRKGKNLICSFLDKLKPRLVHAHDTYGIMVKDYDSPKVFTVHGFIYADTLVSGRKFPGIRSLIWEVIEKNSWSKQPNIISISPYVRERMSRVSGGMIYDIENPVSEKFFQITRKEARGTLFTSAVISPRKNPIALVEAISLLVNQGYDVQLRIAGGAVHKEYADKMQSCIKANRLDNNVVLLGNISVREVMRELATASIYALASLEENSPMGIEEAMAAGIPVVASNRCGMPYMVRNAETGYLVNPLSAEHIAIKLKKLLDDDSFRHRVGEQAKRFALEVYHPDKVAARTKAVYEEILLASPTGCHAFESGSLLPDQAHDVIQR